MPVKIQKSIEYAELIKLAEEICLKGCDNELPNLLEKKGYDWIHTIYVSQAALSVAPHLGKEVFFGFMAYDNDGKLIVVLRCTETKAEILHDIAFLPVKTPFRGTGVSTVASGFSSLYVGLKVEAFNRGEHPKNTINRLMGFKKVPVVICGHSLGGAIAPLLALDLTLNTITDPPEVYTYGAPRTGDAIFASYYNKNVPETYRIVNKYDIVQAVPILPAYWHIEKRVVLIPEKRQIAKFSPLCHHHISTYIFLLEQLLPGGGKSVLDVECVAKESWWSRIKKWWGKK